MRWQEIRSKYSGTCWNCSGKIEPGDMIRWRRGSKPSHVDCETSRLKHTGCPHCEGLGRRWNNAPCRSCDGTGSREVYEFAKAGGHSRKDGVA
jgi:hypothetical protein